MRVLVTGASGQLGKDVIRELLLRNHIALGTGRKPVINAQWDYRILDICDREEVFLLFQEFRPEAVIHCAAWTAVDEAEKPANHDKVWSSNVIGTACLAEACKSYNAKMMFISTDYVFDGTGSDPWDPDCTKFGPMNEYGRSKLEGEKAVVGTLPYSFIVRTSWLFGLDGNSFVKTILRLSETHPVLRVVNDQIGTPTYSADLARLLVDMIETEKYGCYHATNEGGFISWYDFANEIIEKSGAETKIIPVTSDEYASAAPRPHNSRLDKSKLIHCGFSLLPDWRDALNRYLRELKTR